jgi:cell division protein FtsI/penicillin-binding protein 2
VIGRGERIRLAVVFVGLLGVSVAVLGRLVDLQVVRADSTISVPLRSTPLPAARGSLVDRRGEPLAYDRPVYEVRVEVQKVPGLPTAKDPPEARPDERLLRVFADRLVADLLWALEKDLHRYGDQDARRELRRVLGDRVGAAIARAKKGSVRRASIDVLVDRGLDDLDAIEALRSLDCRSFQRARTADVDWKLYLHETLRYERIYADVDATEGVVGRLVDGPLRVDDRLVDERHAVTGLERLAVLLPGEAGRRYRLTDSLSRALFSGRRVEPEAPVTVHSTLDLDLQRLADLEVGRAAEAVTAHYGHPPEWGGMVLVDVRTGGIVAAASYTAAEDGSRRRFGAFAPTQRLFPPGSVVKPLQMALAYERGLIRWDERVDCAKGYLAGSGILSSVPAAREIKDSHPTVFEGSSTVPVRQVLVQSSNIGAVRLGLRLGPDGIEDYLQRYRFGEACGVHLIGELAGSRPGSIPSLRPAEQFVFAGPSVLFGYEIQATILQVARAYLTMLSGTRRDLLLVEAVECDGRRETAPEPETGERFLSAATLDRIKDALVGVVEEEKGTGRLVGQWLRRLRAEGQIDLEIAGKTGTSQYTGRVVRWDGEDFHGDIRTSSFVGFTPVREPRYLVVCVLQKAGASSFYGGTYAAPAAARLLVEALQRDGRRSASGRDRSGSGSGVGGTGPGGSGIPLRR